MDFKEGGNSEIYDSFLPISSYLPDEHQTKQDLAPSAIETIANAVFIQLQLKEEDKGYFLVKFKEIFNNKLIQIIHSNTADLNGSNFSVNVIQTIISLEDEIVSKLFSVPYSEPHSVIDFEIEQLRAEVRMLYDQMESDTGKRSLEDEEVDLREGAKKIKPLSEEREFDYDEVLSSFDPENLDKETARSESISFSPQGEISIAEDPVEVKKPDTSFGDFINNKVDLTAKISANIKSLNVTNILNSCADHKDFIPKFLTVFKDLLSKFKGEVYLKKLVEFCVSVDYYTDLYEGFEKNDIEEIKTSVNKLKRSLRTKSNNKKRTEHLKKVRDSKENQITDIQLINLKKESILIINKMDDVQRPQILIDNPSFLNLYLTDMYKIFGDQINDKTLYFLLSNFNKRKDDFKVEFAEHFNKDLYKTYQAVFSNIKNYISATIARISKSNNSNRSKTQ